MAVYGNLPASNRDSKTADYFNDYFKTLPNVSQNVNDALLGYFQSFTGDKETGATMAASVLYTALNQGIDPMVLIDEFKRLSKTELNAYLVLFLNFDRANTSLIGISNSPQISKYITRAILA
jgi:hypothetical protein